MKRISKQYSFITLVLLASLVFPPLTVKSEVRHHPDVDTKYWLSVVGEKDNKKIAKRLLDGRRVMNDQFEVKNVSFNRRPHPNGEGDYLSVTFDIFNLKNEPFEGYMFVVASNDKRYKKGPHYYVLIDNISPKPEKKDVNFSVKKGFFPIMSETIAGTEKKSPVIGALTRKELINNRAEKPETGIPFRIANHMQFDIKHYMPFSREEKFFDHVTILIYGKEKEKLITYKTVDDPNQQNKKYFVRFEEKGKDKEGNPQYDYIMEEKFPLLYSRRFALTRKKMGKFQKRQRRINR